MIQKFILCIFIFVFCIGTSYARCNNANISTNITPVNVNNPYSPLAYSQAFNINVSYNNSGQCDSLYIIMSKPVFSQTTNGTFRLSETNNYNSAELGTDISKNYAVFNGNRSQTRGSFSVTNYSFFKTSNNQTAIKQGNYFVDSIIYVLDGLDIIATQNVRFEVNISSRQELYISENLSGNEQNLQNLTLDFGKLSKGLKKQFQLNVKSTAPYKFFVTSENGGKLLLNGGKATSSEEWIQYVLNVNSQDYSNPSVIDLSSYGATPYVGKSHILSITIGDVAQKKAGNYKDVLTFTAAGI